MSSRRGNLVWLAIASAASACRGGTTEKGQAVSTACTSDQQCASGICGVDGTGYCCKARCATGAPLCGATGCDTNGACLYPGTDLDCTTCADAILIPSACDGAGTCVPGASHACPDGFACNDAGTACRTDCASSLDCAAGLYCSAGECEPPKATGSCDADAQCVSGVCGVTGTGNCCASPCKEIGAPCGANDCDPTTGACLYADAGVACPPFGQSCIRRTQTSSGACNGLGSCIVDSRSCAPYACGEIGCLSSCVDNDCAAAFFCDPTGNCCPAPDVSAGFQVDGVLGSDAIACCGYGGRQPCQTVTHALAVIASSGTFVTLHATVDGGGGDWPAGVESFPVSFSNAYGVELSAPGVFFAPPNAEQVFLVNAESVSIVGSATSPIGIGINQAGTVASSCAATIDVSGIGSLNLANAMVGNAGATSIDVESGGRLLLGQDWPGNSEGTVYIGNDLNQQATNGFTGISCTGSGQSPCRISDADLTGMSSVVIQGQEGPDLSVVGPAIVSLTSAPVFGQAPSGPGFGTCLAKGGQAPNGTNGEPSAVMLEGGVTALLQHATIQCSRGGGIYVFQLGDDPSPGTLELDDSTIQNTFLGLGIANGTATVSNSTIQFNVYGVQQYEDGTIDLSGGDAGGRNTIVCSSGLEAGDAGDLGAGVANYSYSQTTLNAENVAWDTVGPDLFGCDQGNSSQQPFEKCTCLNASCAVSPGADGMDAVETYDISLFLNPIGTAGASQSPIAVAHGCK